jgi:hypothetical protein
MIWLLLLIHLNITPPDVGVKHAEVVRTFHSEQDCIKELQSIFKDAKESGQPVPPTINMGCVPLNGKIA